MIFLGLKSKPKAFKKFINKTERETEYDTERHEATQGDTKRHRETHRDAQRHIQRHRETQRHKETQRDTERQRERENNFGVINKNIIKCQQKANPMLKTYIELTKAYVEVQGLH